jgi:probable AcnD-accessory protein PrpF
MTRGGGNLGTQMDQVKFPAIYMRGGTSKGVFFRTESLPASGEARDRILLRILGSPDPYGQQIDGMGGATSSTSKVMLVAKSELPDIDLDYFFGQIAIDKPIIDWAGNCGNLTSALGPFAIAENLIQVPPNGITCVRMRHVPSDARINAYIPMSNGAVVEDGDFELDGVAFPAAEIRVEFLYSEENAADNESSIFPTDNPMDVIQVPGIGSLQVTMINAGNPAVFVEAAQIGLRGDESQKSVNSDSALLKKLESIRAVAAVCMGIATDTTEATERRLHTPKLSFLSQPLAFTASSGRFVDPSTVDLNARIVSMGKLHHAMTGTGAIAIGVAAAIPGTIVERLLGGVKESVRFSHPSGMMKVGAEIEADGNVLRVRKAVMSRSARRLMEGSVFVPAGLLGSEKLSK